MITAEQAKQELRRREAAAELERRQAPTGVLTAPYPKKREKRQGVWGINQDMDGLFSGRTELTDLVPLDVGYDLGKVIGMEDVQDRTKTAVMYNVLFGMPREIAFDNVESINEQIFNKPLSPTAAWRTHQDHYKEAKEYIAMVQSALPGGSPVLEALRLARPKDVLAIYRGQRQLGVQMAKARAGAVKMVGELLAQPKGHIPLPVIGKVDAIVDKWRRDNAPKLIEWADMMLEGVKGYYAEHPEEAVQITPGLGYRETLRQYATNPDYLIQRLVESSGLMLSATAGTLVGGPAGGITASTFYMTGDAYADARAEGTAVLPAMAEDIFGSVIEAGIEQWTLGKKLGLLKNAKRIVNSGVPKVMWESAKAFFRGTAEEGSQEFNRNFWRWVFTDRSQLWAEGVSEAAAVGGPMEMIMAGGFASAGMTVGASISKEDQLAMLDKIEQAIDQSGATSKEKTEMLGEIKKARKDVVDDVYPEEEAAEPEALMAKREKPPVKNRYKGIDTTAKEALLKQIYGRAGVAVVYDEEIRSRYEELKESFTVEEKNEFKEITGILDKRIAKIPTPQAKPTEAPERKVSRLAKRTEELAVEKQLTESLGELPTYEKMKMADQAKMATEIIAEDYDRAKRMALGKEAPPKGLRAASIYEAVKYKAVKEGDVETLTQIATESTIPAELSALGQEIKAADTRTAMADPVKAMQDIKKKRETKVKKRTKVKSIKRETSRLTQEMKSVIRETTTRRQNWNEFVESIRC